MAQTAKRAELKRQVVELQRERSEKEEEGRRQLEELRTEMQQKEEKEKRRRERLAVGQCLYEEFQGENIISRLILETLWNFTYIPAAKINESSQTNMKVNYLSFS